MMRTKILFACVLMFLLPVLAEGKTKPSPKWVGELYEVQDAKQVALVRGTVGTNANFSFHVKDDEGNWEEVISCPAYIGKKGWGKTQEGDMLTPRGVFTFTKAFGINKDPGCPMGYTQVDDTHYWVGDSSSERYNQFVSTRDYDDFNKKDSEHIIDYKQAYKYCLNISYNFDGVPGAGSAIFLHCQTKNKFTAGCVAIPEKYMREVLTLVRENCVVIMDTNDNIKNY